MEQKSEGSNASQENNETTEQSVFRQNLKYIREYFRNLCKRQAIHPESIVRGRTILLLSILLLALFFLLVAMAIPEIIQVTRNRGRFYSRIGLFQQCFHEPLRPEIGETCQYTTFQEMATPTTLYFITLLSDFWALFVGLKFAFFTPMFDEKCSKSFAKVQNLCLVSGLTSTCGITIIAYLYNEYFFPIRVGYVFLWISALLHTSSGIISKCFGKKSTSNAVSPNSNDPADSVQFHVEENLNVSKENV